MKIVIWWNIPCKSIVPVARELSNMDGVHVTFISESGLSEERLNLGWELPNFGNLEHLVLSEKDWRGDVTRLICRDYDLHIFNGVYYFKKLRFALDSAIKLNRNYGVISEAYHNPYRGYKRLLKMLFTRIVTPLRVFPRVRDAKFLLSASGDVTGPFINLGWRREQIFPFGYFPENSGQESAQPTLDGEINLLCTGLITKNKGQHLLVEALLLLAKENMEFKCTITGTGPEEPYLRERVHQLDLDVRVTFTGVVSDLELNSIKARSDVLVAPGLEEPWGIRVNEALLCGTPVIASDGVGASELIRSSGAGRVFTSGSVDSLANALRQMLKKGELEAGKKKAKAFSEKITPEVAANYLLSVIKYTVDGEGRKPKPTWLGG